MITRRDLMSGVLVSPMLGLVPASAIGTTRHAATPFQGWSTDRIYSGPTALDDSMGPLCPGDLICLAGRPSAGKTVLLLQIALSICKKQWRNVLFVSLREGVAAIRALAPVWDQHHIVCTGLADFREGPVADESEKPHVWMTDALPADIPKLAAAVRRLQSSHPAGCGLLVLDGWTSDPKAARKIMFSSIHESDLAAVDGLMSQFAVPALLSEAHVAAAHTLAGTAGIPVLLGIQTAQNSKMHLGPKPDDLLNLRAALAAHATQTVWIHRPELYWEDARRHDLRGVVRVVGEKDRFDGAWPTRSLLLYDRRLHRFLSALTWCGHPPRAQCIYSQCAIALQDDLREHCDLRSTGETRDDRRMRPTPRISD